MLPCGVSHDKDVAVTWTWSFSPVNQKQLQIIIPDGLKRILDSDGTLRITDTHEGDVGNYTCNVISRAGNDYVMATLMVNGEYKIKKNIFKNILHLYFYRPKAR